MRRRACRRRLLACVPLAAWLALGVAAPPAARCAPAGREIVIPAPPERARLRYEGSFGDRESFRRRRGWLGRLLGAVAGREKVPALRRPHDVATDGDLVLVTDPGLGIVHAFDLADSTWWRLPRSGRLELPIDVALVPGGTVFVSDAAAGAVLGFDRRGERILEADGPFIRPTGMAWDDARQRLLVVDTAAHRVVVLDASGHRLATWGHRGEGAGELNFPVDVAIAPDGTVWVVDSLNFRLQAFAPDGTPRGGFGRAGSVAGTFSRPKGVAVDRDGHLYVTDAQQDGVQVFDAQGRLLLAFGRRGRGPVEFWMPAGLALDTRDRLFVVDVWNRRVQVYRYLGE